jgi:hypothetical protein
MTCADSLDPGRRSRRQIGFVRAVPAHGERASASFVHSHLPSLHALSSFARFRLVLGKRWVRSRDFRLPSLSPWVRSRDFPSSDDPFDCHFGRIGFVWRILSSHFSTGCCRQSDGDSGKCTSICTPEGAHQCLQEQKRMPYLDGSNPSSMPEWSHGLYHDG